MSHPARAGWPARYSPTHRLSLYADKAHLVPSTNDILIGQSGPAIAAGTLARHLPGLNRQRMPVNHWRLCGNDVVHDFPQTREVFNHLHRFIQVGLNISVRDAVTEVVSVLEHFHVKLRI